MKNHRLAMVTHNTSPWLLYISSMCYQELGVPPGDTVVVGDTVGDVAMGRQAGVGLTIGVLSGIGNRLELAPHSN